MRHQIGIPDTDAATGGANARKPDRDPRTIEDPLRAFATEGKASTSRPQRQPPDKTPTPLSTNMTRAREGAVSLLAARARTSPRSMLTFVACVLAVVAGYLLWNRYGQAKPALVGAQTGTATINSRPDGLLVMIDDDARGRTPLELALPVGTHTLKILEGVEERSIPLVIRAGTTVSQYIDLGPATNAPTTGRLEVTSDPTGSPVRVDGKVAGNTPLTLPALAVGEHRVVVGAGETAVKRSVTVLPGATASIVASIGQPSTSTTGGWVSFKVPFEMQVLEDGHLVGTTNSDRVMLPTGSHRLDLVSTPLEFRTTASVQIVAGKTADAVVTVPNGSLSVNALPWADVEIDGRPVGTTPLANLSLPIGSHEIVWKHPQRGERRRTVAITASSPARIGVDFSE
jgi:hypothetical protein